MSDVNEAKPGPRSAPGGRAPQASRISPPASHTDRHSSISRAVRATSLMTLGSRVGGLARDIIVGRMFGATWVNSAFSAGFQIPNMFRRLLGEGALSAAFIPEYADATRTSREDADRLASLTLYALGAVAGAITVIAELALLLVLLLTPHTPERDLSLKLIMVMLPFMPLICIVAILAGVLQVHGRYSAAASGPVILNAFIIATGGYFLLTGQLAREGTAYAVGIATVLSGVTQLIWFIRLLRPHVSWTRAWTQARPRAALMLARFIPVAIGLSTLQLNTFLDTLIAMWPNWVGPTILGKPYPLDAASNGILSSTARLYQFPLGVFGVSIAAAVFPLLARHAKEPDHFADTLRRGLRLSLYIGLPATIGLILVRTEAVGVLYGHGKTGWDPAALARAAAVLAGFAVGIWAYSLNQVFTRVFYSQGDTKTPMKVSLAMIAVNLALNLTLIWPLREAGLAWATAASAVLQTAILAALCARMLRRLGGPTAHGIVADAHARLAVAKVVLASALMGATVWTVLWLLSIAQPLATSVSPWAWQLIRLLIATAVGGGVYLVLSKVLRIAELKWLLHRTPPAASPPAV